MVKRDRLGKSVRQVLLRKYPNRRLYDTQASRYTSLEEVARLVEAGVDVAVEDARTRTDITRAVLLQALLEERPRRLAALPLALVRRLLAGTAASWPASAIEEEERAAEPVAAAPRAPGRRKRRGAREDLAQGEAEVIRPSPPSRMVPLD